jgi:repressor LexA
MFSLRLLSYKKPKENVVKEITMNTTKLTKKQQNVLDFIVAHDKKHTYAPTLDEICLALNLKSRGSLHKHIQALITAGYVTPINGARRGIRLQSPASDSTGDNTLPLIGKIAAGSPIEAIPQPEHVGIPTILCSGADNYVLEVDGDSMIDNGIFDGDWVVIEPCQQARNGETVVALVDKTEVTLKRIEQQPEETILHPANASMSPMHFKPEQVAVQGKLVGLIRRF